MEVLFIILLVIVVGAVVVYFLNSPMGLQLVRKKSVSTILNSIHAMQRSAPETPLHDLYYSLAEERANQSKWLIEFNYLYMLRDAGCFDPRTAPPPEHFAEVLASI